MSDSMTKDDLRNVLNEVLVAHPSLDPDKHYEQHEWIELQIKKEKRAQERWEKVKVHVLGWGVVGLIGGIGAWVLSHIIGDLTGK